MKRKPFNLKQWLHEPLIHFLILGAALFLVFDLFGDTSTQNTDTIVITAGKIENLTESFRKRWLRPPTELELQGLVEDYIKEEVLYREALAMGLDKEDTIIRRRMRQKMQFLFEDVSALVEPTEDELQAYLDANPDDFRIEPEYTFSHVYLNPELHRKSLDADIANLLEELRRSPPDTVIEMIGDPIMIPTSFNKASQREVARHFGKDFALKLQEISPGQWQGPVLSGYGLHFIKIHQATPGRIPTLAEVRNEVRRDLQNVRRLEVNEATYQRLRERYSVKVEPFPNINGEAKAAGVK